MASKKTTKSPLKRAPKKKVAAKKIAAPGRRVPKIPKNRPVKIMVASTVYHFTAELEQLCASLKGMGYLVINSHIGTVPSKGIPPLRACLNAVASCDYLLGVILPFYGSGITHKEIREAISLNKPRSFIVHRDVTTARKLLAQYMYTDWPGRVKNPAFTFTRTSVLDDIRAIDVYNDAIGDNLPLDERKWAQEFTNYRLDGAPFIDTEFSDMDALRNVINDYNK